MKDNDNSGLDVIHDIHDTFIYIFTDSFIESLLQKALIYEGMNENHKKIINYFILNSKMCNFKLFRIDFIYFFFLEMGYMFDYIEDKQKLKITVTLLTNILRQNFSKKSLKYDKEEIKQLEKTMFKEFDEKIKISITKDIENYKYQDDSIIKNIFLESHTNILNTYKHYRETIKNLICVITTILIFVFIYPFLFKLKYGLIRNIFNTGFVVLYQTFVLKLFNFSKEDNTIKKNNDVKIKKGLEATTQLICEFFENIDIITESDTIDNELIKISKMFEKVLYNGVVLDNYADPRDKPEYVKSMKKFKVSETIVSIVLNDSKMLLYLRSLKPKIVAYIDNKHFFHQELNIINNFVNILNIEPYQVSETILWNSSPQVKFVFTLQNVSIEYKDVNGMTNKVFHNINLNFEKGCSHFFYGNSGSGKTTLINLLMKRINVTSGSICFLDSYNEFTYFSIREHLMHLSCETALFSNSIYYNLIYGIKKEILTKRKHDINKSIIKYMTLFHLDKFIPVTRKKSATLLSKGQKQRIAIIRLILHIIFNDVKLIFLDEFSSNIDNALEEKIFTELLDLQKKYDITIFYVSHNVYHMKYSNFNYKFNVNDFSITKKKTTENSVFELY